MNTLGQDRKPFAAIPRLKRGMAASNCYRVDGRNLLSFPRKKRYNSRRTNYHLSPEVCRLWFGSIP